MLKTTSRNGTGSSAVPATKTPKVSKKLRKAIAGSLSRSDKQTRARIRVRDGSNRRSVAIPRPVVAPPPEDPSGVITPLPRRRQGKPEVWKRPAPARMKLSNVAHVGTSLFFKRLWRWLAVFAEFYLLILNDKLYRRDTQMRRAIHLRHSIQHAGGTLLKIGQQMSLRLDILPASYCEQLALMQDRMRPFDTAQAIAIIERSTGKPLREIFSTFDPVVILSSSVSCVYQAVLRDNGARVAVKVRRPGIDAVFEADLRVLAKLTAWAERLTIIPPSYGDTFYHEVRKTLADELNFRRGARYEELFSRRARKAKKHFFTTPKIYYQYASDEVLIREFASGMWLWEVLASLENGDEDGLNYMQALNLNPRKLAKRLLFIHHWSTFEHLTFHASPSAANIIVGPNNRLTFVDFGANGYIRSARRELFRRFYQCQARQDVWGMAQATVALLEPLPARDLNTLAKEIEGAYYEKLLAMSSKGAHWYERTSVAMWLAAFRIMNKYKIPAPTDVLLFVRATLLYDTLAARLWTRINYNKALRRYSEDFERRQRKRGQKALRERLQNGLLADSEIGAVESIAATFNDLLFRVQRILSVPYDFAVIRLTVEKWVYTVVTLGQLLLRAIMLTGLFGGIIVMYRVLNGQPLIVDDILAQIVSSRLYWFCLIFITLLQVRVLLFRLADKVRRELQ
jgi:predicted unusual protein kinase regulating ubiquinone biosynthesis (AarF/ABC1/UbiB family)